MKGKKPASAALLIIVVVATIVGVEGGLRLAGVHFPSLGNRVADRALWNYDATKGWFHAPGASGETYLGGPDRGRVLINALGLRGPEVARVKPPGTKRILVFGDSFVFGVGVDEGHTLTAHLARFLARSPGGSYEVINMGVGGYSTDQEYVLAQDVGLDLRPDIVVVVGCDNDFLGNNQDFVYGRYYKPFLEPGASGELRLRNVPVPVLDAAQRTKLWLGQHSVLWNAIRSRRSTERFVGRALELFQVGVSRAAQHDEIRLMTSLLLAFRAIVDRAGAHFVFFNTGHRGEQTFKFHALRTNLEREGVLFHGLEEALGTARRRAPDRNWDFAEDTHWNVDSHELAARVVHSHLRRLEWLDTPGGQGALPLVKGR